MRGIEGKIEAIRYARTRKIPFFGICLGMQCAVDRVRPERARAGRRQQHRVRPDDAAPGDRPDGGPGAVRAARRHDAAGLLARASSTPSSLARSGLRRRADQRAASPPLRVQQRLPQAVRGNGFVATGLSPDGNLVEIIELAGHPWFLAVQFHPEFKSKPTQGASAVPRLRRRRASARRGEQPCRARGRSRRSARCAGACGSQRCTHRRRPATATGSRSRGPVIADGRAARRTGESRTVDDDWIAPAFWDIQTNGRWGVSFSDPGLTVEQVAEIVRAQAAARDGAALSDPDHGPLRAFAPRLTDDRRGLRRDPTWPRWCLGIHLEGPYISARRRLPRRPPLDAVRDPDWDEFRGFQDAAGGRVVLMTLAPERPGSLEFIRRVVGVGRGRGARPHGGRRRDAPRRGRRPGQRSARTSATGSPSTLPRHPNPIWEQAALDGLCASFIADGHHLDAATLRVLVRAKGPRR